MGTFAFNLAHIQQKVTEIAKRYLISASETKQMLKCNTSVFVFVISSISVKLLLNFFLLSFGEHLFINRR